VTSGTPTASTASSWRGSPDGGSHHHEARATRRQGDGGRLAAERAAHRAPETGRAVDQRGGRQEGGLRERRQVRVGLRVGGDEGAAVVFEQMGDLLRAGAHVVEPEPDHHRAAREQGRHVGGGAAEGGITGDRGFVDRNGVDEETAVTDDAALSREARHMSAPVKRRPVLEQRGSSMRRAAHGRVDLLEHGAGGEPLAEPPGGRAHDRGRRVGGERTALGVDRDHGALGGQQGGLRLHADGARAREEAARIAGPGQVIGDDRDHPGCGSRHAWLGPYHRTPSSRTGPPGGAAPGPRCILPR
jgi:hypothetical protein